MSSAAVPFAGASSGSGSTRLAWHAMVWLLVGLPALTLGGERLEQGLGLLLWGVLLTWLVREDRGTRLQVAVLIVIATITEHVLTDPRVGITAYAYRFGSVPWYVPPGHGMIYLAALSWSRAPWSELRWARWRTVTSAVVVAWAAWQGAHGRDTMGILFATLLVWAVWRRTQWRVYLGCFWLTTLLELWGTHWGCWVWTPVVGALTLANPPCGVAGAYAGGDALAGRIGPRLWRWWTRRRADARRLQETIAS